MEITKISDIANDVIKKQLGHDARISITTDGVEIDGHYFI